MRGPYGLLPAAPRSAGTLSDDCDEEDDGDYIPVDQMYDKPDPEPKFIETCQKAEFKHIGNFFDLGMLSYVQAADRKLNNLVVYIKTTG